MMMMIIMITMLMMMTMMMTIMMMPMMRTMMMMTIFRRGHRNHELGAEFDDSDVQSDQFNSQATQVVIIIIILIIVIMLMMMVMMMMMMTTVRHPRYHDHDHANADDDACLILRATRRDSLTMSWILRSQAYLAPGREVERVLVFRTSISCLPSSTQPCSNSTRSQVSEFLARWHMPSDVFLTNWHRNWSWAPLLSFLSRTSHPTPVLWWILGSTARSGMDLEKQKPAETTLSPPEVEVETMIMTKKVMMIMRRLGN